MAKRFLWLLTLLVTVALLATACGGGAQPEQTGGEGAQPQEEAKTEAAPAESPGFRIGLVTDVGEIDDKSFNQSAWEGAQAGAAAVGGEADFIETQDAKDYLDNIAEFADDGYNVIVTVGFALGPATIEAAQKWPDVNFIGVDQFQVPGSELPNLVGLIFHEDQSGYLAGVLAANLTKSNTIAAVLGTDLVPPVVAFKEGYELGAQSVKPDINVISTYHPGGLDVAFTDPEWGAATAAQAIDQGADVIFGAGGKTGNGALIETAGHEGIFCIGVDTDQWETVPEAHSCLVSSAMKLITPGVEQLVKMASEGNFPSGNFFGDAGLAAFHDFEDQVPAEVKAQLEEIAAGLKDGSIKTGYGEAVEEPAAEAMEGPAPGELGSAEQPIKVLFVPSVDAGVIVSGGEVMAQALNEATGLHFEVDVPTSYAATVEAMCASPEDTIGFIPALGYVLANNRCGVEVGAAAVRFGLSWYTTQFIVSRDSDIQGIEDLAGKKWAVPDLGSTSGYLYPKVMLQDANVEPGEIVEAGGHPQSVLAVYNGEVDFGTSFFSPPLTDPAWEFGDNPEPYDPAEVTLNAEGQCFAGDVRVLDARCSVMETTPDVFEKTRILTLSQKIPNDTMSFSPDFPEDLRQGIVDAMVEFAASDACAQSICSDQFYNWSGLEPVDDSAYDPVRQLIDGLGYTEEDVFGN
jgi:basic membrane protein A